MVKAKDVEVTYTVVRDHVGRVEKADDHEHIFFAQLNDMGIVVGGMTSEVNGHTHEIKRHTVTEAVAGHNHRFFL
jgi:hypothetical protein